MRRPLRLFRLAGIEIRAFPSAFIAAAFLWALLAAAAHAFLDLAWPTAAAAGFAAALSHFGGELWHQLGHAAAARRAGFPMEAVSFHGLLGTSIYPAGEPALPGRVHVRRALGGPLASLALAAGAAAVWLILPSAAGLARTFTLFVSAENLLVFGLGSLLPLGFTDGSTLLRHLPRP